MFTCIDDCKCLSLLVMQGDIMVNDEQILEGFRKCKEIGALPMVSSQFGHKSLSLPHVPHFSIRCALELLRFTRHVHHFPGA